MLANVLAKLRAGQDVNAVFLGGSITQAGTMPGTFHGSGLGYRDHVCAILQSRYPAARIHEISAAVAGTGSEMGVLRLESDVLAKRPDLLFVEFAVNDGGGDLTALKRNMESIVRQTWKQDPMTDIVFVYTLEIGMFYSYAKETLPASIRAHEAVAAHYGIPTLNLGAELYERYLADDLPWKDYFLDNTHPSPMGHAYYGSLINKAILTQMGGEPAPHALPAPLIEKQITHTHTIFAKDIPHEGWTEEAHNYWTFDQTWVCSDKPGNSLSFSFSGNILGVYWNLAMDTGDVEYAIDGGEWKRSPTWDGWVVQAPQRINYKVWADDLADGEHTVTLRIADGSQWKLCQGNHIRLIAFFTGEYGKD